MGLVSMRERAELMGGELQVDARPQGGTIVHLRVVDCTDRAHRAQRRWRERARSACCWPTIMRSCARDFAAFSRTNPTSTSSARRAAEPKRSSSSSSSIRTSWCSTRHAGDQRSARRDRDPAAAAPSGGF